mmetsp:Transcript_16203/g.44814  ORF Transcript_16203/g.44814 Transcript_16203/m.44814 type:complete len:268 (+) Transcript_16203:481-1284(+)
MGRRVLGRGPLAKLRHDVDEAEGVDDRVQQPGAAAHPDEVRACQAVHAWLAVALEGQAGRNDAHDGREAGLTPPLDVESCEGASRDRAQHAEVVEGVNPDMGCRHAQEQHPGVATRKVKDQDTQDGVQQQVGIAAHLHRGHSHPLLGILALELRMRAHDEAANQQRADDRGEGLDQEGDQVRRWEGIPVRVLGQGPLHAVSLELRSELRDFLQGHTEVRAEAQALHDLLGREVCRDEVQPNVEHARDGVQDHVAGLALVLEAEADAV